MITPDNLSTETQGSQESTTLPMEQLPVEKPVPIEVKWNIPAWILRHPGPRIEVEDDDVAFEEG